jgi:hypothetical protein
MHEGIGATEIMRAIGAKSTSTVYRACIEWRIGVMARSRANRMAAEVLARELRERGIVPFMFDEMTKLAEDLIAALDREDLMIVRRPDDLRGALELTRKKKDEAKRRRRK